MLTIALTSLIALDDSIILPAGSSVDFLLAAQSVESALTKRDFDSASRLAQRLPKRTVKIQWIERDVPASIKSALRAQKATALTMWNEAAGVSFLDVSKNGDLSITLSGSANQAVHRWSPNGPAARVTSTIPIGGRTEAVYNNIAFSIGRGLGLMPFAEGNTVMSFPRQTDRAKRKLHGSEMRVVNSILRVSDELRRAAATKRFIASASPAAAVRPVAVNLNRVRQGDLTEFELVLRNDGNGPLEALVSPDCSCIALRSYELIEAGSTKRIGVQLDALKLLPGSANHRIEFLTNDPKASRIRIPVNAIVAPLVKWRAPNFPSYVEKWPATLALAIELPLDVTPLTARIEGVAGRAQIEKGPAGVYRIDATVEGPTRAGPVSGRVVVLLSHQRVPETELAFSLVSGIWSAPSSIYLGRINQAKRTYTVEVNGPKPFRIVDVRSSISELEIEPPNRAAKSHRLTIDFRRGVRRGRIAGQLLVKTDDSVQPTLSIPVRGVIE